MRRSFSYMGSTFSQRHINRVHSTLATGYVPMRHFSFTVAGMSTMPVAGCSQVSIVSRSLSLSTLSDDADLALATTTSPLMQAWIEYCAAQCGNSFLLSLARVIALVREDMLQTLLRNSVQH